MARVSPAVPLSRGRVLAAGVALADAHGLAAVTMRRLADELGCEAMSIYHHVPSKGALVEGLVDAVVAEVAQRWTDPAVVEGAAVEGAVGWRDVVRARCHAAREVMLVHPWAREPIATQAATPPSSFLVFEELVATLRAAGFPAALAHRAIHALGSMVLGFTHELFEPGADDPGTSPEEMVAMAAAFAAMTWLGGEELHASEGSLSRCDTQAEFAFTLDLVLDGLEARRVAGDS
jgi:AcrR family transcriptional regulator